MSVPFVLRRVALVLTWLFAVGGLMFALGYAFEDPGGWVAVLLTAAVAVPLIGLTVLAWRRPAAATGVLLGAVVLFAAWAAVTLIVDPVEAPTVPVVALILGAPIAVVGQRDAWRAGVLLIATAAIPFVLLVIRYVTEAGVEGPGFGSLFGTSTGVVVIPLAFVAALFLIAGSSSRHGSAPNEPSAQPTPPAMSR